MTAARTPTAGEIEAAFNEGLNWCSLQGLSLEIVADLLTAAYAQSERDAAKRAQPDEQDWDADVTPEGIAEVKARIEASGLLPGASPEVPGSPPNSDYAAIRPCMICSTLTPISSEWLDAERQAGKGARNVICSACEAAGTVDGTLIRVDTGSSPDQAQADAREEDEPLPDPDPDPTVEEFAREICIAERMNPDDKLGGWLWWQDAARAAMRVADALRAAPDARVQDLEVEVERLTEWNRLRALDIIELGQMAGRTAAAEAKVERLKAGVQAIVDGDYEGALNNGTCRHGIWSWDTCGSCIDEALTKLLASNEDARAALASVHAPETEEAGR